MRKAVVLTTVVAGALAAAHVAFASIPDKGGTIHACYDKTSVRIYDPEYVRCQSGEVSLDWNQEGHAGPPGPAGPQGPAGPAPNTRSLGVETGPVQTTSIASGAFGQAISDCPAGKVAISGELGTSGPLVVIKDFGRAGGSGWEATAFNADQNSVQTLTVNAVCVNW
jgi:hypothetical protein